MFQKEKKQNTEMHSKAILDWEMYTITNVPKRHQRREKYSPKSQSQNKTEFVNDLKMFLTNECFKNT